MDENSSKKKAMISFRLNQNERDDLFRRAEEEHKTISDYIRDKVLGSTDDEQTHS